MTAQEAGGIRQRIDEARGRHPLAEVARRTGIPIVTVSGAPLVRCPLPSHGHPDRTPSMRLHLGDGRYHCFGCGARGDVVQWVRDAEGAGLADAIRILDSGRSITNAWAGIAPTPRPESSHHETIGDVESVDRGESPNLSRTTPDRVQAALQAAWRYYTYRPLHTRGVAYLSSRGIDIAVLETHTGRAEVGHSPAKADGLVDALRAQGFVDDELVDSGLAYRRIGGDQVNDFYRHRVLLPLRDEHGEVCGLIGRNTGDARWPKYKNPPRTHLYDKSVNLYQPLPALAGASGQVVVVEGTLDALAIAAAAISIGKADRYCPVTQSGRELSEAQIEAVLQLHDSAPVLGFDSDPAGRDSAYRYSLEFAHCGKAVRVTMLPQGHDPASWLAERGPRGVSVWSGHNHSGWDGPGPLPGSIFVAQYIRDGELSLTRRMCLLIEAANLARRLPTRTGQVWAHRMAEVAGPVAVAESCAATTDGADAIIERIAIWGRQFPWAGDAGFLHASAGAMDRAGILPRAQAFARLHRSIRPGERSRVLSVSTPCPRPEVSL